MPNHQEIASLKETFGENWREGMRKNPHIDRMSNEEQASLKAKRDREKKVQGRQAIREGLEENHRQGKISNEQMRRYDHELSKPIK